MTEFLITANRGRVYLRGKGEFRANPIHGADLAKACVKWLGSSRGEFNICSPGILTQNRTAMRAFEVLGEKPKITCLALCIKNSIVTLARVFTSAKAYGFFEFFMTLLAMDVVAPAYGQHIIKRIL
jgi:hypothetical protein